MADVRSGLDPTASNGALPRPRPAPGYSAASPPSGIRTPRMILRDHEARQAARRAEQEQIQMERERLEQEMRMQRARAEEEARAAEEAERRNAERRAASAAAAAGGSRTQGQTADPASPVDSRRRYEQQQHQQQPMTPERGPARASQQSQQPQARPRRGTTSQGQQYPTTHHTSGPSPPQQGQQPQQPPTSQAQGAPAPLNTTKPQSQSQQRTSFPHAFERWEALSAQWEGLTSHWIRRLELNAHVFDDDPVSQQLSRQVTDLSAAGANLFHAVVELQRLRASSERKFQRWFFETRTDMERSNEAKAVLEAQVAELKGQLSESRGQVNRSQERDSVNSVIQKQLSEMKKELAISKEESRRAWEELGRREQLERERTLSLQAGQPTIVGGVQVVPMVQSASAASRRDPREQGGVSGPEYGDYSQIPAGHPVTTTPPEGGYYRDAGAAPQPGYTQGSEGGYSEGESRYVPHTPRSY